MKSPGARMGWGLLLGVSVLAAAGALGALKRLGYSTSWVSAGSAADFASPPRDGVVEVGPLRWDVEALRTDPVLAPYRERFGHCAGQTGAAVVECVYGLLAEASPIGDPTAEFVDANYDPSLALESHLRGAPGHCTTRSALTATALLALGVPARIVQVYPATGNGHNITGVFVDGSWRLFDPAKGDWLADADGGIHSSATLNGSTSVVWRSGASVPDLSRYVNATVLLPEPWLYLRTGKRVAPWPFRAVFVRLGEARADLGTLQRLALFGVVGASALALLALLGLVTGVRLPRLTPSARPTGGAPTVEPAAAERANAP